MNSRTYGKHTRAARGSKTPATLNRVLATHAAKTAAINIAAKAVYDVLKIYGEGFREGQLWQALLSRMRSSANTNFETLLQTLKDLELNSRYTLKRFINLPQFFVENNKRELLIEMKPASAPCLNKNDDCYRYELIVLLFNNKGICIWHEVQRTRWISLQEKISKKIFHFQKTARTKHYLLCLHLQGGVNGVATDTFASRGMAIVPSSQV